MTPAPAHRPTPRRRQRGAALLVAMIILTLVATLAAGMVWQQYRAIQVETAERARVQSAWILNGALEWARLILRENWRGDRSARNRDEPPTDHLGEPWAVPLEPARLSTFLAADRENANADDGPEAFLSGRIIDAQSRWNLNRLVGDDGEVAKDELPVMQRLCEQVGVSADVANRIADGLKRAHMAESADAPLTPSRLGQLAWLGIDADTVRRLEPYVAMLGSGATVNVNTAPREVLAAVLDTDLGTAEKLVQARQRKPFKTTDEIKLVLPPSPSKVPLETRIGLLSNHFIVEGELRLEDRVVQERSLVRVTDNGVTVLQRERINRYTQTR